MSDTKDLKDLLARLKSEVGPAPQQRAAEQPRPAEPLRPRETEPERPRAAPPPRREPPSRYYKPPEPRPPERGISINSSWSENKETMLFGVLASLIIALGGIVAGLDYLVLTGALFFIMFSTAMFLALFGYYLNFRKRGHADPGLIERVDALSKKVEILSTRPAAGGQAPSASSGSEKERELEHKVEELRTLVKTLAKAVDGNK